ncbi:MAG: hypothetical protein CME63_08465 [Halobacteriovoraceae bacterium]|nr:hypothetical protein [Halobacteriovoraceae bacterium]MBC97769.1 hypothetical protein [Halobacteriovoraceae bacterium]|tara:strand:+ start:14467 stop:15573 length:1107 start_codon:yes stop_codon:yes gene_type:complete
MKRRNKYFWLFSLVFLLGCESTFKNGEEYVHYETLPPEEQDNRVYPLSLLQLDKKIDVILTIDNSGSMSPIQQSVIDNARLFFNEFAKASYVDWKIGLISTDWEEDPYLGFDRSFDSSLVTPNDPTSFDQVVSEFQYAVGQLGISGSATETTFLPVHLKLEEYKGSHASRPSFLRDNAHLVVISITDEAEQSMSLSTWGAKPPGYNRNLYEATSFYNFLSTYINSNKILRFYGGIQNREFAGCDRDGGFGGVKWDDTEYAKIIKISNGFYVPACSSRFGSDLARIAEDITSLIGRPSLLLRRRPKVETLKVYYKGRLLKPGREAEGGFWYYDESSNTINFYGLEFVDDIEADTFEIDFEVDDGIIRQY